MHFFFLHVFLSKLSDHKKLRSNRLIPEQTAFKVISGLFLGLSVIMEEGTGALSGGEQQRQTARNERESESGRQAALRVDVMFI